MFLPLRRARWPLHTKMGRICKVAVEMTRRINRGESQTGYSPALGNPHQTRVPHSTATATAGCLAATRPNPAKSGSLPDSCTEPKMFSRADLALDMRSCSAGLFSRAFVYPAWQEQKDPMLIRRNSSSSQCACMMPLMAWAFDPSSKCHFVSHDTGEN